MSSSRAAARDKNAQGMMFMFPWNNNNSFPTDIKIWFCISSLLQLSLWHVAPEIGILFNLFQDIVNILERSFHLFHSLFNFLEFGKNFLVIRQNLIPS
jgi:hypothetical protein